MSFDAVEGIVGKKRTLEILCLLAEEGTLNYSDIEDRVETSSDVISNRLNTLGEHGLIERIEKSQRNVRYSVTDRGEQFLSELADLEAFLREEDGYA